MKSNELGLHVLLVTFQFMCEKSASFFFLLPAIKFTAEADSVCGSALPPGGASAEISCSTIKALYFF